MIEINGEVYDGVTFKPDLDDALAHYGVMGMKWGIRKDLKKTGSISKKTKGKINKAVSKASYGKTKRMLNVLEKLKADYTGEREMARARSNKQGMKKESSHINKVSQISNDVKKAANKKGYKYETEKKTRLTRRANRNIGVGYFVGGIPATVGTGGYMGGRDSYHRRKYKTNASPYAVSNTTYYRKKRK